MPDEKSWEAFQQEFDQIRKSEEFKSFLPILNRTQALIGFAQSTGRERERIAARALLSCVKSLRSEQVAGRDPKPLVDRIAGGYLQDDWIVKGDVKQANRDFIDQTVVMVIGASARELDLATHSPNILVPIVLVAMTRHEAEELVARTAFQGELAMLESAFTCLQDHLHSACEDWLERYGATSREWKPFGSTAEDSTIEQLITDALEGLEQYVKGFDRPLVPDFRDIQALNRAELVRMRESGCIVVLDVISIRHPKLQRAFHQSLLDAYPKTSIVTIAPSQSSYEVASHLTVLVQLKVEDMEFLQRCQDLGDYGASEQIFEKKKLKPWLSSRLKMIDLSLAAKRRGAPRMP